MKYVGSKKKIQKYIVPFIKPLLNSNNRFIDMFAGGMNIVENVKHHSKIANDNNKYLIAMYNAIIHDNWQPEYISYKTWEDIKNNKHNYPDYIVGYAGLACSYKCMWFYGYAHNTYSEEKTRCYQTEVYNSILKQKPKLSDTKFVSNNYNNVIINKGDIIYCDPPYKASIKDYYSDSFNHDDFYSYIRRMLDTAIILISEYEMPKDFISIWQKEKTNTLHHDNVHRAKKSIENLFIHESQLSLIKELNNAICR